MNNEEGKSREIKRVRRHISGISWRLFGSLILFVAMILIIIWVFQIVLLNRFYENSKIEGFGITNEMIELSIGDTEDIKATVYTRSVETDTCIRVFKIVDGEALDIADSDVSMGCFVHHTSGENLYQLYSRAESNGGIYSRRIVNPQDKDSTLSMVHVAIVEGYDSYTYVIMQDSELVPLNATVKTLERQFGWIMSVLLIGALILALILSRHICLPMERMSASARQLAKGDYSTEFRGGGYREANELAEALNYAADELAKNDRLQKELVANISHDLRTPLTMIKGYSEVMRDIPGENTPENVQVIIDETERLTELVNDMLDLSKIRSGTRKPEPEVFDLTETVGAVLQRYEKFKEKEHYIIRFEKTEGIAVMADRTMILQVVYNLVNNALNYTGEDKTVTIRQTVSDGRVRISVIDTGSGIDEKDIPYIWDRYYKVDKVHKRAVVGTGLGLSIVKGILESHGALYGVNSEPGKGSTFWFELDAIYEGDFFSEQ